MPDTAPDFLDRTEDVQAGTAKAPRKKSPVVRALFLLILCGILGSTTVWIAQWWTLGKYLETTNNAYLQADQVVISPKIAGYVQQVLVTDNETVVIGQPLVKIDSRQLEAAHEQDRATIAARQADLERAAAELAKQPALLAQAHAQQDGSAAQERFAAGELTRYNALAEAGADTTQKLDQAQVNSDQAAASLRAQSAAVDAATLQGETLKAQFDQAQAALDSAKAQMASRDLDLSSTLIRSAVAGRVADRTVRAGQFVQPGTRLMDVVPVNDIYLVANFKETQIGRLRVGQPVTVRIDALKGVTIQGHIESLAPGTGAQFALFPPQNATGNFTKIVQRVSVRIVITPSAEIRSCLLPGMSSEVSVDTRPAKRER